MALYWVLREGVSQRESGRPGAGEIVARAVGDVIEVSDEAAPGLVAAGYIERCEEDA